MTNLIVFNYKGQGISRRDDGFINLTQMCQANGKRLDVFMKTQKTKDYISVLGNSLTHKVVYSEEGVNGGTWGHPVLASNLARWISIEFAVWVDTNLVDTIKIDSFTDFLQSKNQDKSGFIYLAQASQTQWCKIGMSKQPYKRMQTLQTGSPLEIILLHRIYTFDAIALEKSLHEYFDAYRVRGEWFDFPIECIQKFPIIANQLDAAIEQVCLPQ